MNIFEEKFALKELCDTFSVLADEMKLHEQSFLFTENGTLTAKNNGNVSHYEGREAIEYQTIRAIGVSGLIGPLLTYGLAALKGPLVSHGSMAMVIIRQVAATFGTAVMVFCVAALLPVAASGEIAASVPYQVAFAFSAVMGAISFMLILTRVR